MTTADPLTALAYWEAWQHTVIAAWPDVAAQGVYVEQASVDPAEVQRVVEGLRPSDADLPGRTRDLAYGGRRFETALGPVTRMWVDSAVEIGVLRDGLGPLAALDVLEIGAGYGRLAALLGPLVGTYTCVDAVAISVDVCRTYTQQHAAAVRVLDVAGLRATMAQGDLHPTLAINIHSWNECTRVQIAQWLNVLDELCVPSLFTVSHGRLADDSAYRTCEPGEPSFRPLLEARYRLVIETSPGIGSHPHALWSRA